MKDKFLKSIFYLFFFLPYIFLFYILKFNLQFDSEIFFSALKQSLIQSVASAFFTVVLGIFLTFGLFSMPRIKREVLAQLMIVPALLPSLFSILVLLAVYPQIQHGNFAIICTHIIMNVGFAAYLIYQGTQQKILDLAVVANVYGIQKSTFLLKIYFPLMRDIFYQVFFLILLSTFSSFSVPLILGRGANQNIEILLYEKIFLDQQWGMAILVGLFQMLSIFLLSLFIKPRLVPVNKLNTVSPQLMLNQSQFLVWGYIGLFFIIYSVKSILSVGSVISSGFSFVSFFNPVLKSFIVFALLSVVLFLLLSCLAYLNFKNIKFSFLKSFIYPSTLLIGFSVYMIFPQNVVYDLIKIVIAFSIVLFWGLYRNYFEPAFLNLEYQKNIARAFSIDFKTYYFKLLLPQIIRPLRLVLSLLLIVSLTDFAVLRATGAQYVTLGKTIDLLLGSYRFEWAYAYSFAAILIWFSLSYILGVFRVRD